MNDLDVFLPPLVLAYFFFGYLTAEVCGDQKVLPLTKTTAMVYNRKYAGIVFIWPVFWLAGICWLIAELIIGIYEALNSLFEGEDS